MEPPTDVQQLIGHVQQLLAESAALKQRFAAFETEHAALKERFAVLETEKAALKARNGELGRRLGLNSSNSGKPPSSDGLKKPTRTKSLRESSGKEPGGQKGHPGETLRQVENPDVIINHYPEGCAKCGLEVTPDMATGTPLVGRYSSKVRTIVVLPTPPLSAPTRKTTGLTDLSLLSQPPSGHPWVGEPKLSQANDPRSCDLAPTTATSADRIVGRHSFRIEVPDEAAMASLKTLAIVFMSFYPTFRTLIVQYLWGVGPGWPG
jgi:hypothetical protein